MELAGIYIFSLLIRLPYLSNWFEDWDSVQFAMAMHKFDIANQLPHAPGYPLYILLGKIFFYFTKNDLIALNLVSVLLGSLSILLMYFLASEMFNKKIGFFASLLTVFVPVHFLLSVSSLSNIPGLFFLLLFGTLIYKFGQKYLIWLSFLGGLILGFRFTEITIIVSLLALYTFKYKYLKKLHLMLFFFMLGIITWLIPMIFVEGFTNFINAYSWVTKYIITHDATNFGLTRIKNVLHFIDLGYTKILIFLFAFSVFKIFLNINLLKENRFQFLAIWFLSYFIPYLFIYNTEVVRYTLPLLPVITIMIAWLLFGGDNKNYKIISFFVSIFVIAYLCPKTISEAKYFKTNTPPTIEPILWVKENLPKDETIINGSYVYRQFEYYLPQYKSYYGKKLTEGELNNYKYIVIDYIGLKEQLPKNSKYKILKEVSFSGNPDIYSRIPKTTLYLLGKENE